MTSRARRRTRWILLGLSSIALVAAPLTAIAVSSSAPPALAAGNWSVQVPRSTNVYNFPAVTCAPGTSDCWALGGNFAGDPKVLHSTDGGASWAALPALPLSTSLLSSGAPDGVDGLDSISCPTASDCVAGGEVFNPTLGGSEPALVVTTDGGESWTPESLPSSIETTTVRKLTGVSCASTSTCIAVGNSGTIVATTNGGTTWSSQTSTTTNILTGVSCVSTSTCIAVGQSGTIVATTDATSGSSATWTAETSTTTNSLNGVSCVASSGTAGCIAVGASGTIVATSDGGSTWTAVTSHTTNELRGVSCVAGSGAGTCIAVGASGTILATTNGGSTWVKETSTTSNYLNGVSCVTAAVCVASSSVSPSVPEILVTTSANQGAGATWAATQPAPAPARVNAIDCPAPTTCFAADATRNGGHGAGFGMIQRTTNGSSWQTIYVGGPDAGDLLDISCANASDCIAVGYSRAGSTGVILSTTNGGSTWVNEAPPSSVSSDRILGVDCTSATACTAVGGPGYGVSGSNPSEIITTANATSGSAATWTAQTSNATGPLYSVACPGAATCFAVGSSTLDTLSGGTWAAQSLGSVYGWQHRGISCPDTTHCFVALSKGKVAYTTNGTTWSVTQAVSVPAHTNFDLHGMSCSSDTNCVATGGEGEYASGSRALVLVSTNADSSSPTWTQVPTPFGNVGGMATVACTSAACWAGGEAGGIISTFSSPPSSVLPPTLTSVSPSTGPASGGTRITLTGTNLANAAFVEIGGVDATGVTDISPTEVSALSPPGAAGATEPVQVITPGGTSPSTGAPSFTYTAPPPAYFPLASPARICDTRAGNPSGLSGAAAQCEGKTLSSGTPITVQVTGLAGVPADASAVVANLTAIAPSSSGTITAYPAGGPVPSTTSVSFASGENRAGVVEIGLSSSGALQVATSVTSVGLAVDVEGYVAPQDPSATGALYDALTSPGRICDTRAGNPSGLSGAAAQCQGNTMSPNTPLAVQVTGVAGVPASATAVVVNLTVVDAAEPGYLTAYPAGSSAPTASNVNFAANQIVPNRAVVGLSSSGAIDLVSDASLNVVVDVSGYFTAGSLATGTGFHPETTPLRLASVSIGPDATQSVPVAGQAGIPADVQAVVVTLSAISTTRGSFLTAYPGGTLPVVSDLNWPAGGSVSNLAVVTVPSGGAITLYNYVGSATVQVDVLGWYS